MGAEPSPLDHPTIPPGRAQAFHDAIRFYPEWWGETEPHVTLDLEHVTISTACEAVLPFRDPLPENVFGKLFAYLHAEHTALKVQLDADPTYATAAHCFLKLIEIRKVEIRRRQGVTSQIVPSIPPRRGVSMIAPASMSTRLAVDFFEAVRDYIRWAFGDSDPSILHRHLVRISLVCGRSKGYTDPLPDEVFEAVEFLLDDKRHKEELRANPTYDTAARFFLEAIEAKKQGLETPHRQASPDC